MDTDLVLFSVKTTEPTLRHSRRKTNSECNTAAVETPENGKEGETTV